MNSTRKSFQIIEFSKQNLINYLKSISEYPGERIEHKYLVKYLLSYFDGKSDPSKYEVRTMIVENEYVSETYHHDYKFYYVDSYKEISKKVRRIHFFKTKFETDEEFESAILKKPNSAVKIDWDGEYFGYIVIRELNNSIFGPCVIRVYSDSSQGKRLYNSCINYRFDVFGNQINNFRCLPFLEQDGNIGVCATSAIWSCLFKTSKLFRNKFPIPHEITSAAGLTYSTDTQPLFPNKGLNTSQIAKILEHYNLTFENIGPKANEKGGVISHAELKKICYSYNKMGIPILLGYKMFNNDTHMVCITGYLSGELNKVATGDGSTSESMAFQHNTIKELYAHNDQFGPYESIDFSVSGNKYQKFINAQQEVLLSFQIEGKNRQSVPIIAIIPLDKKIRVSYSEVYSSVNGFSYLFDLAKDVDRTLNFDFRTFCWDVYLDFSSNFKQQRVQDTSLDVQTRKEISFKPMPKFIWVASLRIQNKLILEFIVDSNSITNSFLIFDMFFYDISFAKRILAFFPSLIDKAVNDNYLGQFRSVRRRKFYNSWLTSTHSRFLRKKLFSL